MVHLGKMAFSGIIISRWHNGWDVSPSNAIAKGYTQWTKNRWLSPRMDWTRPMNNFSIFHYVCDYDFQDGDLRFRNFAMQWGEIIFF
jgi:hypothetical protein